MTPSEVQMRLLLCSSDSRMAPLLGAALGRQYDVEVEPSHAQLKRRIADSRPDVVILDFEGREASEPAALRLIEDCAATRIPVVAMMNDYRRSTALELMQRGAAECIQKPPALVEFKILVRRAHEHAAMRRELEKTRELLENNSRCDRLIGSSGKAQVVYDLIRRVADLDAFVLINGESGTGKELVARAIHNLSRRAQAPFVAVACGAIPETLIEAELFGHERGAFTGSTGAREGYIEQAGNGTLFLDEIGELSQSTQVKLLRLLQQREFRRLGSSRLLPLRARVLFATHRDLASMVEEGTFRRDLYFRVNVMRIPVPPLRERTEDIPMLARHFLDTYAASYGKHVADIRPSAMEMLVDYDWPGNIRELENAIQGAVILADGDSITPADLPDSIRHAEPVCDDEPGGCTFERQLRQYKLEIARRAIENSQGNKTMAARSLGISRAYLHRLVRREPVGIDAA